MTHAIAIATVLNHEYQAGGDEATLRAVARGIRLTLPESERAGFTDGVEMCGLWLD
jgi:hypothetical protein